MEAGNTLLYEVEAYVTNFISEQVPREYAYHDVQHTLNVVATVEQLGNAMNVTDMEQEILLLAAWFHDTGYDKGSMNHEERSCRYAREYLSQYNYLETNILQIEACIMATKMPHQPDSMLEKIMCDADMSHLGKKVYWDRCNLVRQELTMAKNIVMDTEEWLNFELRFLEGHRYHTKVAKNLFEKRKAKHIRQLKKQQRHLFEPEIVTVDDIFKKREKAEKRKRKLLKKKSSSPTPVSKQADTQEPISIAVLHNTFQTQAQLSSQADQKANFVIGINAIAVVISFALLLPNFETTPLLIVPTLLLLSVCLASILLAIFATRPSLPKRSFEMSNLPSVPAILQQKLPSNSSITIDQQVTYQKALLRDLSVQATGLLSKYRYLHLSYSVFLYGLIGVALAFVIAFLNF